MSSHQVELNSMLVRLKEWNESLGGNQAKKIKGSEFDFLQEEFLITRHQVEKAQDRKEKEGLTTANAGLGIEIREGIEKMKDLVDKLKAEHRRIAKKQKDPPEVLERKLKIVQNCEHLLHDIEERETEGMPVSKAKAVTLTEMKAKLLKEIDENNALIHEDKHSDGKLSEDLQEDKAQISKWKKKEAEMDLIVDDIITGVKGLKGKVKAINEAQGVINQKTGQAAEKVDKLSNRIQGDNQKLKKIIEDFKPSRCCLYVAFFLLLIGLVVCVIKLLI